MNKSVHRLIESVVILMLTVTVFYTTLFTAFYTTPDCILQSRGLAAPFLSIILGVLSALIFIILTTIVHIIRKSRTTQSKFVMHIVIALSVIITLVVINFILSDSYHHIGSHNCKLIPWSP